MLRSPDVFTAVLEALAAPKSPPDMSVDVRSVLKVVQIVYKVESMLVEFMGRACAGSYSFDT